MFCGICAIRALICMICMRRGCNLSAGSQRINSLCASTGIDSSMAFLSDASVRASRAAVVMLGSSMAGARPSGPACKRMVQPRLDNST